MAGWELTRTRLVAGVWEGVLTGGPGDPPPLVAEYRGRAIDAPSVARGEDSWTVRLALPAEVIADGVQTVVIADGATGDVLESLVLIAGDALAEDLRAEVDLLRAELDMLKRAFRRHCVETA